jgi:hypothetical protein
MRPKHQQHIMLHLSMVVQRLKTNHTQWHTLWHTLWHAANHPHSAAGTSISSERAMETMHILCTNQTANDSKARQA